MPHGIYDLELERNPANYQPLTPLTFLERAADVHPDHVALIHGPMRRSYAELRERCHRLGSALAARGLGRGDTVAVMLANTPAMLECHYGVPMCGAVLNTLNTRLDAPTLAFILDHGEARALIADREFSALITEALALAKVKPLLVDYDDPEADGAGDRLGTLDYEALIESGDPAYAAVAPVDEWDALSLNYTSGTTSNPKGVVYHHRGAHLLALGNVIAAGIGKHAVYLWTLPMFHCNGWCFPWSVSVVAGTHVCLRQVRAGAIFEAIRAHGVTHMSGAPVVMSLLLGATEAEKRPAKTPVTFLTAGAPPPEAVLARMRDAGFAVTHLYGLTETYGPAVVNEWQAAWDDLPAADWAARQARQGVRYAALEGLDVMEPETMTPVPADGQTLGEVMFRGNVVMKGYLKNREASREAFAGGWFHSGDLAVKHPDGYIQLKDRSKDIIISGGENISSIEVEDVLYKHPAVACAAVVAQPDEKWGETPCAFVELHPGSTATADELIAWCRDHLAHYKAPRHVRFVELPRTSTGKLQKFKLRQQAGVEPRPSRRSDAAMADAPSVPAETNPSVLVAVADGVATLTLDRPSGANALSSAMIAALHQALRAAEANPEVRVLVLAANGKIFSAGHDLAEMRAMKDKAALEALFARCSDLMRAIRACPKPVIAKVQGAAVAAGCQLVATCDLAYAAETAKFGVNGINLGLFCATPSVALSRAVQPRQALELLLTGRLITAARAAELGLVNAAVPRTDLDATVAETAALIAAKLPEALRLGKALFWRQQGLDLAEAYALACERMAENMGFAETGALVARFLER